MKNDIEIEYETLSVHKAKNKAKELNGFAYYDIVNDRYFVTLAAIENNIYVKLIQSNNNQ